MAKATSIKYTDKNFDNLRTQLIELAKNYFPDSYNDFSPTSPGMMFIEMAAYVGDVLSFYQDTQVQETYLQYAKDPANLYSMAYMLGYRPKVSTASSVDIEVTQRVEASGSSFLPDFSQALAITENAQISDGNEKFIISNKVDFSYSSSYDPTDISVFSVSSGNPDVYLLKKTVKATSGEIKTKTFTVGSKQKFLTLTIDDEDIINILDITESGGDTWTEVPYLGQSTVFNTANYSGTPQVQKPQESLSVSNVEKRFVSRFNSNGQLLIQFGGGDADNPDSSFLPNPTNIGVQSSLSGIKRLDYAYDPSNFIFGRAYGVAPSNTTLTVRYLKGGGIKSNVPANSITTAVNVASNTPTFTNGSQVKDTLTFNNPQAATGGKDGDTVDELRQNSLKAFNEQGRMVTKQDFEFRALAMPANLGSISKVYVAGKDEILNQYEDSRNPLAINLYVLSYDINKNLVTSHSQTKTNLRNYLNEFKIITDSITIRDAFVVNIGVKFEIITRPNYNSRDVILRCNTALQSFFDISKWSINQPINLADIYILLDKVTGVQTVQSIDIFNKNATEHGTQYSIYGYDVQGATKNNIIYPSYDPCIFEVKYPNTDIEGRVTTL